MRLVVIGSPGAWHVGRIRAVALARGHDVSVVEWRQLGAFVARAGAGAERATSLPEPCRTDIFLPDTIDAADAVIVRGMPAGRLEEVILRMDLLGRLAERGTPVINSPRALETAIDKYLSLARLAAAGIRVPRTIVAQDPDGIRRAWETLGGDAVVKPLFGSCGRGIERIDSEALLRPLLTAAAEAPEGAATYLQEYIPHAGWDARILLVGEEVFSIRRRSATDWRTNLARGGIGEPFEPPPGLGRSRPPDLGPSGGGGGRGRSRSGRRRGSPRARGERRPGMAGTCLGHRPRPDPGRRPVGRAQSPSPCPTGLKAGLEPLFLGLTTRTVGKCDSGLLPLFVASHPLPLRCAVLRRNVSASVHLAQVVSLLSLAAAT